LLWDPHADVQTLLTRYCDAAFGNAGDAMRRFYLLWAAKADYLVRSSDDPAMLCDMSRWRNSRAQYDAVTQSEMGEASGLIEQAQRQTLSDAEAKRLDMVATHFAKTRAEFDLHHRVQGLYAHTGEASDLVSAFTDLAQMTNRRDSARRTIDANPQWNLAGGDIDDNQTLGMDMAVKTGLITAIVQLRRQGQLPREIVASLPQGFSDFDAPLQSLPLKPLKVLTKGTYWALPQAQARFKPMEVKVDGASFSVFSDPVNDRVEEGSSAGQMREHWAMVLVPTEHRGRRLLYEVQLDATAADGVLTLDLSNPFKATEGDGLPVATTATFDGKERTIRRTLVVEPIGPASPYFNKPFQMRTGLLWSPAGDDARCRATVRFTMLELDSKQ
jgi:hypothetical protein